MNVSLTPELEKFVIQKTESGMYHSASEVIRQALRLLIESERDKKLQIRRLNAEIDVGLNDLKHGDKISGDRVFSAIKTMSAKRKKNKAA